MKQLHRDEVSRLAVAFLELDPGKWTEFGEDALTKIGQFLSTFTVRMTCAETIRESTAEQAALLTAINIGKRCYKGGVYVSIPPLTPLLLPWPGCRTLNEVVDELGAIPWTGQRSTVTIGIDDTGRENWNVYVNGWTAVVSPPGETPPTIESNVTFPLGGILGGALAIGLTFLKEAGFDFGIGRETVGLSLWRPDLHWSDVDAMGPKPCAIADKFWLIGLGHLGQAYAWVLGLLPFQNPAAVHFTLQDTDRVVKANLDAAVLCSEKDIGYLKTRIVGAWLEKRGFSTALIERLHTENFPLLWNDPAIILAGLHDVEGRRTLNVRPDNLVLDMGLGGGLDFDLIRFHAFPNNGKTPLQQWPLGESHTKSSHTPELARLTNRYLKCGFTVGISSAFTGTVAACIAVAEVLRSNMQGIKVKDAAVAIRELSEFTVETNGFYSAEVLSSVTNLE